MSQYIREPITVLGPNATPSPEIAEAYAVVRGVLVASVKSIMRHSPLDAVTAHTLLFQNIAMELCVLDISAADKYIDAMRRNLVAGMNGDRTGVALAEMVEAGQALEDAYELKTRTDAGSA